MNNEEFILKTFMATCQAIVIINTQTIHAKLIKRDFESKDSVIKVDFAEYVRNFLKMGIVHKDDISKIEMLTNTDKLREICNRHENGTLFCFRVRIDDQIKWYRMIISIPEDYSQENPEALFICRKMSAQESDIRDAHSVLGARVVKVIKCDLAKKKYIAIKLQKTEEYLRPRYASARYAMGEHLVEEEFVYKDDLEEFRKETNYNSVISYFAMGHSEKVIYYRRKTGSIYKWVKMIILKASEYNESNPVFFYYIFDIHRALTRFFVKRNSSKNIDKYKDTENEINLYYDTLVYTLSFFTQKYIDFYVIDLDRDQYIKYKVDRTVLEGTVPYVGSYSELMDAYITQNLKGDEREIARCYDTPEKLKNILVNNTAVEFGLTHSNGERVTMTYTRLESVNGVPTKVIAGMVPCKERNRLKVKTFGSFEVYDANDKPIKFTKKKSKQLLAYLIDKYGYDVATADIVQDVLERPKDDLNAIKYVSTLLHSAVKDLENAGYTDIIIKEWNSMRVDVDKIDCDYYHLMDGDTSYLVQYHDEYMKQYSWAEETNAEILYIRSQ